MPFYPRASTSTAPRAALHLRSPLAALAAVAVSLWAPRVLAQSPAELPVTEDGSLLITAPAPPPESVTPAPAPASPLLLTAPSPYPYPGTYPGTYPGAYPGAYPMPGPVAGTVPPAPPSEHTPERIARDWNRRVGGALTLGAGAPYGVFGGYFDWNPSRLLNFNAGLGFGGTFGFAFGLNAYVRPVTWGRWAPFFGGGFSFNVTPSDYHNMPYIQVPDVAAWLNLQGGMEHRFSNGFFLRGGVGIAWLLNTASFTNQEYAGWYGPMYDPAAVGWGPVAAADAHDDGNFWVMPYVHFDVGIHANIF